MFALSRTLSNLSPSHHNLNACLGTNDEPSNPCSPSPCGPNSVCREVNGLPACSCQPEFVGRAPNCRHECTLNAECSANLACISQRCRDPCPGSCGVSATCSVVNHSPVCVCDVGYSGDPFSVCHPKPSKIMSSLYKIRFLCIVFMYIIVLFVSLVYIARFVCFVSYNNIIMSILLHLNDKLIL